MRRHLLGMIALLLIFGGFAGAYFGGDSTGQIGFVPSSCIRIGFVLGTLWLAFPQLLEVSRRVPPWLLGSVLFGCAIVAIRPRAIAVVAPLLLALLALQLLGGLLRPPPKKKSSRDRSKSP